jgi:hypothetical protein
MKLRYGANYIGFGASWVLASLNTGNLVALSNQLKGAARKNTLLKLYPKLQLLR